MLWDSSNYIFIGLFSTRDLASKYMIRTIINDRMSDFDNSSKQYFKDRVFNDVIDYEFISCNHININIPIYFRMNKLGNHLPLLYLTNDELVAKKNSGNKLYKVEIDKLLNLNL